MPTRRCCRRSFSVLGAAILAAAPSPAQEREPVPAFPAQAEAITVDVVVLDKDGRLVEDLAQSDFTLFEDGRPQPIVGFEHRALTVRGEDSESAVAEDTGAASNEGGATTAGRTLAFLVDDLGIEPLHMTDVTKALSHWLGQGADPRDEVTVVTTSGDAWWSATVGEGRADLEAVLARIKGKKQLASIQDPMSDWEAYSIDTLGTISGSEREAVSTATTTCTTNAPSANVRDRVVDRWLRTHACPCDTASPETIAMSIRSCRALVDARSHQVYGGATRRAVALLEGIERLSRGLAGARGRKSVIVVSESLLRDTDQRAFDRALDTSRRGNTAVSFVDARGLFGLSAYNAEQTAAPKGGDLGSMTLEASLLETAGGEYIADTTGGSTVRNTNDLAGSVTRLADESSAYYLLGYQSDRPLDGRWHKLEVKVSRPGVKVRARRGYFASPPVPPVLVVAVPKGKKNEKKGKDADLPVRSLDPALAVGGERDQIPLRIAPYVMETDASGTARVLVAIEVGTTPLAFSGTGGERKAQIDVTVVGVSRDKPKTVPLDSHVELGVDAKAVGGWWTFTRELRLPPGPAQIRALVRDTASGRSGLVARRIEVPPSDAPYLSTPILSDYMAPAEGRAGSPRLVPVAHRRFAPHGQLYCAYEVYVAPGGRELRNIPRIDGGYTVEDSENRIVASAPLTPISIALGGQITRLVSIPLDGLAPGRYRLSIQTGDRATGMNLNARETFVIEPPTVSETKPD